jgi:hypothetical protein
MLNRESLHRSIIESSDRDADSTIRCHQAQDSLDGGFEADQRRATYFIFRKEFRL